MSRGCIRGRPRSWANCMASASSGCSPSCRWSSHLRQVAGLRLAEVAQGQAAASSGGHQGSSVPSDMRLLGVSEPQVGHGNLATNPCVCHISSNWQFECILDHSSPEEDFSARRERDSKETVVSRRCGNVDSPKCMHLATAPGREDDCPEVIPLWL